MLALIWVRTVCIGYQQAYLFAKYPFSGAVKPVLSGHSKGSPKIGFQYRLWDNSTIFLAVIKLPISIKTFVLPIFKWPLQSGFIGHT